MCTRARPFYSRHPFSFALVWNRCLLFLCVVALCFVNESIFTPCELCPETMKRRCKERDCLFPSIFFRNGELRKMMGMVFTAFFHMLPLEMRVQHPPALSWSPCAGIDASAVLQRPAICLPPLPASHSPSLIVLALKCPQVLRWSSALKYFPTDFLCSPPRVGGRVPKPECAFALHPC